VARYRPPKVRRAARAGAVGYGIGLVRGVAHVASRLFTPGR
jgi:hypothetical protein